MSILETQDSNHSQSHRSVFFRFWKWTISPSPALTDVGDRRLAELLASLSLILIFPLLLGTLSRLLTTEPSDWFTMETFEFLGLVLFSLIAYILSRTSYFQWGSLCLVTAFSITAIINSFANNTVAGSLFFLIPAFVIGSALLQLRSFSTLVVINVAILFILPIVSPGIEQSFEETGIVLTAGLLLIIVVAVRNLIERERLAEVETVNQELRSLQSSLEQRVTDATRNLTLAAEVGQRLSLVRDTGIMLTEAVEMIGQRFDLYYTQVYLTDPTGRTLIMRAGTGEAGQTLLRRGHRLPVDLSSLNGIAAAECRPLIVENTETSPLHRPNPLLPDTRSEMVIPLRVGERVVGVLDMQSAQPAALSAENLPAFETLAGQLAISVVNARLFEEAENARTMVEEQARRLTSEGWYDFMDAIQRSERIAYTFDQETITPFEEPLLGAMDENTLAIPIQVSGEPVGTFQFERETLWTEDDHTLVNTIAQQVSQQIDNLRLLAQAEQYQAEAREALQRMTREGWAQYQEQFEESQVGFVYSNYEVKALEDSEEETDQFTTFPITVQNEAIGQLQVLDTKNRSNEDIELITFVNEQLSAHLENIRLTEQTQYAFARTDELYEISQSINEADTEAKILEALAKPAHENGAFSAILMYLETDTTGDLDGAEIVADWRVEGDPPNPVGTRFSLLEMPRMKSWLSQPENLWLISDIRTDERLDEAIRVLMVHGGSHSVAAIPLTRGREKVGVLMFNWHQPHEFSPQEAETYQALIGLASPAVQSRRLFEQAQARSEELDVLNEMGRTLTSLQDEQAIYETIFEFAGKLMDTETFFIATYDRERHEIEMPLLYEDGQIKTMPKQPAGKGLTNYIIQTRKPLLISTNYAARVKELEVEHIVFGDTTPVASWLGVPLVFQDRIIGIISVQSNTSPGLYSEHERDLLTAIASQASVALENATVFRQTQQQVEYETMINQISQRIQSTTSVENALQVAIRELGRALGAKRTNIQLGLPSEKKPGN